MIRETNTQPLVSVGVPVYNAENCVRQALDSILGQTYRTLEVIISDNASTDQTGAICLEYARRDARVRYFRNAVNIGVILNYRRVVELASGAYFMWAAADDVRPAATVEHCLALLLKNPSAVMTHGPILVKVPGRKDLIERANKVELSDPQASRRIRAFTIGIKHNGMLYGLYRREALARVVLRKGCGQDYLLCLQMCLLGPLEYVSAPIMICSERNPIPTSNPMYRDRPITALALLTLPAGNFIRHKCWVVLLMGSWYLSTIPGVKIVERVRAVIVHVSSFAGLYRSQLVKEIVLQMLAPLAWLGRASWWVVRRWEFSGSLGRKLKTVLSRT